MNRPQIKLAGDSTKLVEAIKAYLDEVENRTYSKGMDELGQAILVEVMELYCGDKVFDWIQDTQETLNFLHRLMHTPKV